jgi:endo-1,4-beta-D-glucanase Y
VTVPTESASGTRHGRLWWPWLLGSLVCMFMPATSARALCAASTASTAWPAWSAFKQQFVSPDGRVIDPFGPRRVTTSEGQAYSLFFALVANDRAAFDLALQWSENNLAAGDLRLRLPAWQWGLRDDGSWDVIDPNAASDADLWMVYALGEAGRLWTEPRYRTLAVALADRVLSEETVRLDGLGRVLLPGPQGFGPWTHAGVVRAKVNPSYLPLPVLRWLARGTLGQPDAWRDVLSTAVRALDEGAPRGLAADWLLAQAASLEGPAGWLPDDETGYADAASAGVDAGVASHANGAAIGSYNAIRVYLWLGLTNDSDPARRALLERYAPMADLTAALGVPPEVVDPVGATHQGSGPPGFSAALLPFLDALGRPETARQQSLRLTADPLRADAYYEQALALFAMGHRDGYFRFDAEGHLLPRWDTCAAPSVSAR